MGKKRLDVLLVEKNLIETREKAKRVIMAGLVFSNEARLDKPGMKVDEAIPLRIKEKLRYVGRGGLKLEKALNQFSLSVKDKIMVDVGSSTGGFTDCGLQNGVRLSYAIDVGYNQLDWKLRNDPRVITMERTNFRYVTDEDFLEGATPNFAAIDVSFISLRLILPVLKKILAANSDIIALIKPQFEAGREQVGRKGIVRENKVHLQVVKDIVNFAIHEQYHLYGITFSPITGGDGNIEFLAHFGWKKDKHSIPLTDEEVEKLINQAQSAFYPSSNI
jgi:23S rRNA (cytidine1920-2'-O)/16S rRNA (cytidine1409-2'-O)-methyltransferase